MKIWFGLHINAEGNPVIVSASADREQARNEIKQENGSHHMLQPVDIELLGEIDDAAILRGRGPKTIQ
jgi:hypothetical protein